MSRHARLTVLERGSSPTAWASCHGLGADDWIVVAQQVDEPTLEFAERVSQRAGRLCREDAELESIDVYTAPSDDREGTVARRAVIESLGARLARGGRLTLWSDSEDGGAHSAELSAILAQFGPVLAEKQVAMNHQAWEPEERSGVRHAIPKAPATGFSPDIEFDAIC
jgi:hypothetical protein